MMKSTVQKKTLRTAKRSGKWRKSGRLILASTFLISTGLLSACGSGDTSSNGCTTSTQTDANGNPITTVGCN